MSEGVKHALLVSRLHPVVVSKIAVPFQRVEES